MMTNAGREADARLLFINDVPALGAYKDVGDGILASVADGDLWVSLHTASPGVAGTQSTSEATYTGYARLSLSRTSGDGEITETDIATGVVKNAIALTFGKRTNTGSETITYAGLGTNQTTAGNLLRFTPLALTDPQHFVSDVSITTPDLKDGVICPSHGYSDADRVMFFSGIGGTIPTEFTDVAYYVINSTTDYFEVSATEGGSVFAITNGSGYVYECNPQTITLNSTPAFAIDQLVWKSE